MNPTLPVPPEPAWTRIGEAIDTHQRFLVTTHMNPDGDGLGAELGLWGYLKALGKDARIVNPDAVQERYGFLEDSGQFEVYDRSRHDALIEDRDVLFVLDISRWERLGPLGATLRGSSLLKICIDHHPFEGNGMADLYGVDVNAAATGQLVYELIRGRGHDVDSRMALGFYVSILTDTGSFRFSNSDARAHRAAAELLGTGLKPHVLYEQVYGNHSLGRLRLLGLTLDRLRAEREGRIILLTVPLADRLSHGVEEAELEGFVDPARSVAECEMVALLIEREDGALRVSLRSRGRALVNRVASRFDGGGHAFAAGAVLPGPPEFARGKLLAAMDEELDLMDRGENA